MDSQTQPECPEEYKWMKPGAWAGDNHGFRCQINVAPHQNIDGDWVILNGFDLPVLCEGLRQAYADTDDDRIGNLTSENKQLLARIETLTGECRQLFERNQWLEDRANAAESMLDDERHENQDAVSHLKSRIATVERVKALLDGVGPEIAAFDLQHSDLLYGHLSYQQFGEWCANQMPDFVLKTQAVWEVLKGE